MSSPSQWFRDSTTMTIASFSEAKKLANGKYIKSAPISAGGHTWRIAFYPNGRLAGTTASMSLFLLLDDGDDGGRAAAADDEDNVVVHARFRFKMTQVCQRWPVFVSGTVDAAFSRRRSNAHGFERFVSRDDFEKTALFKSDIGFQIVCGLTVFPPASKRAAAAAAVQTCRRPVNVPPPAPSVVQAPPPPRPVSPKPSDSVVRVPLSAPPPTPATPTPSVVTATVPPPPPASPKPSVVTAAPPAPESTTTSPAPSVAMSSAPPPSVRLRPDPLLAWLIGTPASLVPPAAGAGQKARAAPPLSGLPADLGHLLATKKAADVELEVCGKVFAAHKSVLAARSPVFMEELFGVAKEEGTSYVLVVPDMRPAAFEALLHYLYTDTLPPETEMAMAMTSPEEQGGTAVTTLAEDLLAAADRYELKDLKLLTENKLCNHVGVGTVLPMLALAERFQCGKLKKTCLGFMGSCGNTRAVMATNGLEILGRSSPSVMKDVITEILDAAEARRMRLVNICIFALCFILPFFLLFAILCLIVMLD